MDYQTGLLEKKYLVTGDWIQSNLSYKEVYSVYVFV